MRFGKAKVWNTTDSTKNLRSAPNANFLDSAVDVLRLPTGITNLFMHLILNAGKKYESYSADTSL